MQDGRGRVVKFKRTRRPWDRGRGAGRKGRRQCSLLRQAGGGAGTALCDSKATYSVHKADPCCSEKGVRSAIFNRIPIIGSKGTDRSRREAVRKRSSGQG